MGDGTMKYLILSLLLCASVAQADYYYARVQTNTLAVTADYRTIVPETKVLYGDRVIISISQQEYDTKVFTNLAPRVSAAFAARKHSQSDYETWQGVDKDSMIALVKVLLDEINILRVKVGLPERTAAQLKAAIRSKL